MQGMARVVELLVCGYKTEMSLRLRLRLVRQETSHLYILKRTLHTHTLHSLRTLHTQAMFIMTNCINIGILLFMMEMITIMLYLLLQGVETDGRKTSLLRDDAWVKCANEFRHGPVTPQSENKFLGDG